LSIGNLLSLFKLNGEELFAMELVEETRLCIVST
jgi:hypothetical protein